jgi:hypothetical protein
MDKRREEEEGTKSMEKKGRKVYEERGPGEGGVIIILKCSRGSWGTHP